MRFLLCLATIAALLSGCGQQRTLLVAPPPSAPTVDRFGAVHQDEPPAVAPVYAHPRDFVYLACQRAARAYFHQVTTDDAAAGRLTIMDREVWAGDVYVEVAVVPLDAGRTRVEVMAEGRGINAPVAPATMAQRRMRNYLKHVDDEVRTLEVLQAQLPQPGAQPAVAAEPASTGASSGTSQP